MKIKLCALAIQLSFLLIVWCGCVSSKASNDSAFIEIAKREMRRHGWTCVKVERCAFEDNVWTIDLQNLRCHGPASFAIVRVAPNGSVIGVLQNLK
jgi:hypothetical protein